MGYELAENELLVIADCTSLSATLQRKLRMVTKQAQSTRNSGQIVSAAFATSYDFLFLKPRAELFHRDGIAGGEHTVAVRIEERRGRVASGGFRQLGGNASEGVKLVQPVDDGHDVTGIDESIGVDVLWQF